MKRTALLVLMTLALAVVPAMGQAISKGFVFSQKKFDPNIFLRISGTWWRNPQYMQFFNLTADQQKKMDEVFQESRIRLIPLNADLELQEALLEPLMEAERLEEAKALAQIDRVAQARAELEKANSRMLLGIRQVMTADQWAKLQGMPAKIKDAVFIPKVKK
jgi:Spy/CpxP family protein refolding chaperone